MNISGWNFFFLVGGGGGGWREWELWRDGFLLEIEIGFEAKMRWVELVGWDEEVKWGGIDGCM